MASLNVSMPDDLREFIDKRTNQGGFSTSSEYVRHLVREDKRRQTLEGKLLEALDERSLKDLEPDFFDRLRARLPKGKKQAKHGGRRTW